MDVKLTPESNVISNTGQAHLKTRRPWLFSLCFLALCYQFLNGRPFETGWSDEKHQRTQVLEEEWQWANITPDENLVWHNCYEDFQCARLEVPLDWQDLSNNRRAVIAVIKLPAVDEVDYKGPMFFNPGGPGGSGVQTIRYTGKAMQKIVGDNHDIITFDPRGVGATIPRMDCFETQQNSKLWSLREVGVVDSHPGVVYDAWARATAFSHACANQLGGENGTVRYVSTAYTARDMLEILNKTGHDKLRYWGFSYGTVLGGTFAAMYPDKVERLVSDGNVDYTEWTTCTHERFLDDADKVMDAFFYYCHKYGVDTCPIWENSPVLIARRVEALLERLKTNPVVVPSAAHSFELPEIVTYSALKRLISAALYRPIYMFSSLARIIAALEAGDGKLFVEYAASQGNTPFSCNCKIDSGMPGTLDDPATDDAFPAIMCTDGGRTETLQDFIEYTDKLIQTSSSAGAVNTLFRLSCAGWKPTAKWRFTGPFTANTHFPILFVANTADNVTPMRSARANMVGFPNSTLLIQDSYGHTTLSAPSLCTTKTIRAYFQNGRLPAMDIVCEADMTPFQEPDVTIYDSAGVEDMELGAAILDMARYWPLSRHMRL